MIEKKTETLGQASAGIAQRAYAQQAGPVRRGCRSGGAADAGRRCSAGGGSQAKPEDNVVDAEFEEVRDKGRRAS